jgi:arylsulfatase A-like enzyme
MRTCKRFASSLLVAALAAPGCHPATPAREAVARLREQGRPNLVLVVVDALRADPLSAYGASVAGSPEIARWAAQGVVFERALAQSSWTKSSMASLLTSRWPRGHGVLDPDDGLGEAADTLAEKLREAGYRTWAVQSNGWLEEAFGFEQGFERYLFPRGGGSEAERNRSWPHADNVYREAERLIDAHASAQPFFLYLHFMDVHEYAAPPDVARPREGAQGEYAAAIRWVDEVLARLREHLDRRGLLESSVLLLASDHAEAFGENGAFGHARNVFTPVLHVPLVLRLPFAIEPTRILTQVRNLDVAPTLLDLAGLPPDPAFEGESLLPLLADPGAPDRPSHAALGALIYADAHRQEALNDGAWSYVRDLAPGGREWLFDRRVDPDENVDLSALEPAQAARLRARLDAGFGRAPAPDRFS